MDKNYSVITSRSNKWVSEAVSLTDKKNRDELGLFLCEGVKLFFEALDTDVEIVRVFVTREAASESNVALSLARLPESAVNIVTDDVFSKISTEKAPQGVICVIRHLDKTHKNTTIYNNVSVAELPKTALLLDAVADPGNVGTIIRTAAALGIGELILGPGCADIYNPRTVRASMGALLRQRITRVDDLAHTVSELREFGARVYAATLDAKFTIDAVFENVKILPIYIIIGNEGHGIDPKTIAAATSTVTIPISDSAESLNAAIAASIFMWELHKHKHKDKSKTNL
jgi:rRNA methylases